jgi:hypothetical protein
MEEIAKRYLKTLESGGDWTVKTKNELIIERMTRIVRGEQNAIVDAEAVNIAYGKRK